MILAVYGVAIMAAISPQSSESAPTTGELPDRVRQHLEALVAVAESTGPEGVSPLDRCLRHGLTEVTRSSDPQRECLPLFLAMAVLVDSQDRIQGHSRLGPLLEGVEDPDQRDRRKQAAKECKLNGRQDLATHFFLSAALARMVGARTASRLGLAKEIEDAERRDRGEGTGFSFADLCANEAGARFSDHLREHLTIALAHEIALVAFMPSVNGLDEELSTADLDEQYGGPKGERLRWKLESMKARIGSCAAYRKPKGGGGPR